MGVLSCVRLGHIVGQDEPTSYGGALAAPAGTARASVMAGGADEADVQQARDVMAFGRKAGRVLSDGRVVGRAEPFAKVFPSSRSVKRAVGLVAWGVLEDIALERHHR